MRRAEARAPGALDHWHAWAACVAAERRLAALIARSKELRKRRGRARDGNVTLSELARTQTHLQHALETLDDRLSEHVRRTEDTLAAILLRLTPPDFKPTSTSATSGDNIAKNGRVELTERADGRTPIKAEVDVFSDAATGPSTTQTTLH